MSLNRIELSTFFITLQMIMLTQKVPLRNHTSENMILRIESIEDSKFCEKILFYMSGFIVSKFVKKIDSQYCKESLIGSTTRSDHGYCIGYGDVHGPAAFTAFVNNGGLTIPSESAFRVVKYCEKRSRCKSEK